MEYNKYCEITPDIIRLANMCAENGVIDSELFTKYEVKRGLRDLNGKGVLAGLTHISDVRATEMYDLLMKQLAEKEGINEQLKSKDPMAWVGAMNNIRNAVEEIINAEVIFA